MSDDAEPAPDRGRPLMEFRCSGLKPGTQTGELCKGPVQVRTREDDDRLWVCKDCRGRCICCGADLPGVVYYNRRDLSPSRSGVDDQVFVINTSSRNPKIGAAWKSLDDKVAKSGKDKPTLEKLLRQCRNRFQAEGAYLCLNCGRRIRDFIGPALCSTLKATKERMGKSHTAGTASWFAGLAGESGPTPTAKDQKSVEDEELDDSGPTLEDAPPAEEPSPEAEPGDTASSDGPPAGAKKKRQRRAK